MRVSSLVLCAVLCTANAVMAQEAAVGVKAGVNLANLQFDGEEVDVNFDRRAGFVGGVFAVWPANQRLALQTEALFSQKGAQIEADGEEARLKLDFLDIPVLLRVSSDRSEPASFHVFGGPSVGFRLRARATSSFEGESESEDISDDVARLDLGVVVGAGADFGRFTIDGRHTWGLSNLNNDDSEDAEIKSRVFSIMAGIRF